MQNDLKQCKVCKQHKPLDQFAKAGHKNGRQLYKPTCYECIRKPGAFSTSRGYHLLNRSRVEGDTAYIELTDRQGVTVAEAMVSAVDLPRVLAAGRWHRSKRGHTDYCGRSYRENGKAQLEWLHRFIMGAEAEGLAVDHINGNGLDDRRQNLRCVTHQMNQRNRHKANGASDTLNVHHDKKRGKWLVRMHIDGKLQQFGAFDTVEEARPLAEKVRAKYGNKPPQEETAESPPLKKL